MLTNLTGFVNETTNALFIGHHGSKEELAAVGIGNMLQNCCGLSIGIGLSSALDTLVSQAHGAGDDQLACIYMQRARIVVSLQMVWILPVLLLSDRWLIALGQDPEVARLAAEYNAASAPFLICWFWASVARRFLASFLLPKAGLVVGIICAVMHVLWCYIFVARLGLGNRGLGFANGITWTLRFLLLTAYLAWAAPRLGLSRRSLLLCQKGAFNVRGCWTYLKTALPALVQTCSEWWFWEICALYIGYLGSDALAAHVTTQNFFTLLFMVPCGVSQAAATLTGNALGAGQAKVAKQTAVVSIGFMLVVWSAITAMGLPGRRIVASAYTSDSDVDKLVGTLLAVNLVAGFFDSSQNVMGGICRGIGKLRAASATYLWSFYALMLPLSLLLAFPLKDGIVGVYLAMVVGTACAALALALILRRTDWQALAEETKARLDRERDT
eukprot:TRINITY_DN17278_c0_g1_i2.p1 TRINITY_DN17278_c0_g1~~TRINITY_DN17278_c0_g1_i2.p1  ORF type:complete len:499 (-),score=82.12 TRINITY_DN17278_c0_g1_i2:292-1617(-)